jgi:hypothetical protein
MIRIIINFPAFPSLNNNPMQDFLTLFISQLKLYDDEEVSENSRWHHFIPVYTDIDFSCSV